MNYYHHFWSSIAVLGLFLFSFIPLQAQKSAVQQYEQEYLQEKQKVKELAEKYNLDIRGITNSGDVYELMAFENDHPVYWITYSNRIAQQTIAVDEVHPGGETGYDLSGAGVTLGEWDAGAVRKTHQEFGDRVTQVDGVDDYHSHATHVAGILMAAGVKARAEGMSFNADLKAHDWGNANSEMAAAAGDGLVVSNHSYGRLVGWGGGTTACKQGSDEQFPKWYGNPEISQEEDFVFGFYTEAAEKWDEIAYNNPKYLIVKSAGNDRGNNGPSDANPGHCVYQGGWQYSEVDRQPDGGSDGFDSIGSRGNAKNILSVGAIRDIEGGYEQPSDVQASGFTSFGPTDDGRIKPDVVANGVGLYSPVAGSDTDYASYSGTSMSSPSTAGAIGLLHELYHNLHGTQDTLRAATIKSLVIQTTNEAGSAPGPDYKYGWGLVNIRRAADLIHLNNKLGGSVIHEMSLQEGDTIRIPLDVQPESSELNVTVGWTDPPANSPSPSLDPTTPMLVNDVDMKLLGPNQDHYPWKLDGENPSDPATKGENNVDNIEKATVSSPTAGRYVVQITHDGSLAGGSQKISLILDRGAGETYEASGRLTINGSGEGAAYTNVFLSGFGSDTTKTDSLGYFEFQGLYNGDYTVNPQARGVSFTPESESFTVDGSNVQGIDFTANTPGYRNITLRLNTATLPDTLQPTDTLDVRGNISGTSEAADQLPDGNILSWDQQSTLTMSNDTGDYWRIEFQVPEMQTINFKYFSSQNQDIGVGGLETGSNHQIMASIGHKQLPLHFYEKNSEVDHPYNWAPWKKKTDMHAVQFRLYVPIYLDPFIIGVKGNSLNGKGPLRNDQPRVTLSRESTQQGHPGYRLYSGIAQYDTSLAGKVQNFKYNFVLSDWTEASWRSFSVPDRDTTLHWTYTNNGYPFANNYEVTVQEDSSLVFNPTVNDSDPEGDSFVISKIASSSHGTAAIIQDTLVSYEPDTNYSGKDQFTYWIADAHGAEAKATIKITVENQNDPPAYPVFNKPEDSTTVHIDGAWDDHFVASWDSVYDPDGDELTYHWQLSNKSDFSGDGALYETSVQTPQVSILYHTMDSLLTELNVESGQTIGLQHRVVVDDGTVQRSSDTLMTYFKDGTITSLNETEQHPQAFELHQNYPNPFNPSTSIKYSIAQTAHVKLVIYNTLGQKVATLVDKTLNAGTYQTRWNASNHNSGLYMYRLEAGPYSETKSMILVK